MENQTEQAIVWPVDAQITITGKQFLTFTMLIDMLNRKISNMEPLRQAEILSDAYKTYQEVLKYIVENKIAEVKSLDEIENSSMTSNPDVNEVEPGA